jgi:hypothetical protein
LYLQTLPLVRPLPILPSSRLEEDGKVFKTI